MSGWQIRPREGGLHLAAGADGEVGLVDGDVAPVKALALLDVALEAHVVRQAEGQVATLQRVGGRSLLAPNAEAALPVQHLARLEAALGGRDHVRVKADWRAGRL